MIELKHTLNKKDVMSITAPKNFATITITLLGASVFSCCPLWMGIFFVIPGFSLFLRYTIKKDLRFIPIIRQPIYKKGMAGFLGCSSLVERKNKYGF